MNDALRSGLQLVDASGYVIIVAILVVLAAGVGFTFLIRGRYRALSADLRRQLDTGAFESAALRRIARDALEAAKSGQGGVNTQVIIEQGLQAELRGTLIGERFLKACTGLLIVLGLVGTFYGLTLSIGKLAALIGGDAGDAMEITETLTAGLTQALSGMSVAFSTSLFGISSAIVMTLISVFFNVQDLRLEVMGQIEAYVDNVLLRVTSAQPTGSAPLSAPAGASPALASADVAALGESVARLEGVVAQFDAALQTFARNTRDFGEFNLHLKDNVQRMSLGFGDLGEALKEHARALKARD